MEAVPASGGPVGVTLHLSPLDCHWGLLWNSDIVIPENAEERAAPYSKVSK